VFLRFAGGSWIVSDLLAENASAIYLVHYLFVVWLQYALLGPPLPAIAKGLIVFSGTLVLSRVMAVAFSQVISRAASPIRRIMPHWCSSSAGRRAP
jgi:hypothetical protein